VAYSLMITVRRIFDIPQRQRELFSKPDALIAKKNGTWTPYSTESFIDNADKFSLGLMALGLKKQDNVAIISANRPEWNIADIGMLQVGVVNVPIYTTLSESEIIFILNDCKAKMVFAGDNELYAKIDKIRSSVPSLIAIYSFDEIKNAPNWTQIISKGMENDNRDELKKIKNEINPDDLATILYTSGTTGTPKGVMLSHDNIISNVVACEKLCPVDHRHRALSFLPLCHSYERMLTYYYMYLGVSIYYAESMEKIVDNLKEVSPQVFSTVPRLLEKVFDRIMAKGKEQKGIKKFLFFRAVDLGLRYELNGKNGFLYELELKIMNMLVFSKWRKALGNQVRVIVSGGAALQPRLARVFWAAKIHVLEGYGLTETSPVIAVNNLGKGNTCFGTVGPPIKNVDVKIAEDGEILVKGPNIMLGYYNRPDLTAEVIDKDKYFHTGDIGQMVDNRYLKITDRKKEIFKTSGGKYIAPQALENKFKESNYIEQIMVIGENRKFAAALIVPDFAGLKNWCELNNINFNNNKDIINNPKVYALLQEEVKTYNKNFGNTEQIKKFRLVDSEWTTATGELTATLKLKRKIIAEKYKNLIEEIYNEASINV
jgi:long-chain acyl-CoA synthetase